MSLICNDTFKTNGNHTTALCHADRCYFKIINGHIEQRTITVNITSSTVIQLCIKR